MSSTPADMAMMVAQRYLFRALLDTHPDRDRVRATFEAYLDDMQDRVRALGAEGDEMPRDLERFREEILGWFDADPVDPRSQPPQRIQLTDAPR